MLIEPPFSPALQRLGAALDRLSTATAPLVPELEIPPIELVDCGRNRGAVVYPSHTWRGPHIQLHRDHFAPTSRADKLLATWLHELVHLRCHARGIPDTEDRDGTCFHLPAFATAAEALGLRVTGSARWGLAHTTLGPEAAQRWARELHTLQAALDAIPAHAELPPVLWRWQGEWHRDDPRTKPQQAPARSLPLGDIAFWGLTAATVALWLCT